MYCDQCKEYHTPSPGGKKACPKCGAEMTVPQLRKRDEECHMPPVRRIYEWRKRSKKVNDDHGKEGIIRRR
jgi:hypothetical protein